MFFKRGNRVYRKNPSKGKEKKPRFYKVSRKSSRVRQNTAKAKRTEIAPRVHEDNPIHLHKNNWHSHGNSRPVISLSKKSSSVGDLSTVASYLEKLDVPNSQLKADARNLIDKAKKILQVTENFPEKPESKEDVIQSLAQPSDSVDSNRGSTIISSLLHNIASEVEGDTTPLDEYLKSVALERGRIQRNIVTKRPLRKEEINKKRFLRVLSKDELKKIDDIVKK